MNISRFFIDRPIFAGVLSLLIFIAGFISLWRLPISEYPEVVPPSVVVHAQYPGANPQVIADTVAAPLEEQINGVEDMLYMFSQGTSDGQMTLTITFKIGTDPDKAQQLVQNRVNQALPRLPDIVRQFGVTTIKSSSDLTLVVHLLSPDNRYDNLYLSNYATLNVKDRLSRIQGIGQVQMFGGSDYAMRLWLDPEKIAARGMSADDVINAVREQNIQVAAGVVGGSPSPGTELQLNVNEQGRLQSEEEFANIIIKTDKTGAVTRLKDVARIELGASQYALRSLLDNKPAVALGIFQSPGSNALQLSDDVRSTMEQLKKDFPEDVDYDVVYDPTSFVRESIRAVIHTLLEAITLVVLVVILFLQTWRASIIPLLAVPVSIIGTFALMHFFGFSINALTLFGLVLSIGIVVDDAIVVVENVERNIENGLSPKDATYQAMREVSGPIIAIALSLIAVFVPIAFISGLTGQFYRQFALTIACSTVISAFNSLTLSPAMAALLLRGHDAPPDWLTRVMDGQCFGWFFRPLQPRFQAVRMPIRSRVGKVLNRKALAIGVYLLLIGADRVRLLACAHRLYPAAGQAISDRLRAVAGRLLARPHRGRHSPHVRNQHENARRRSRRGISRPFHQRLHQQLQRRPRLPAAQRFRGAQFRLAFGGCDRRQGEHAVRRHSGCVRDGAAAAADSGPWHVGRLQAADRRPRRSRRRGALRHHAGHSSARPTRRRS